ncbi:MAG: FliO/MopB family protein, partial [Armatimonadota bacterium]
TLVKPVQAASKPKVSESPKTEAPLAQKTAQQPAKVSQKEASPGKHQTVERQSSSLQKERKPFLPDYTSFEASRKPQSTPLLIFDLLWKLALVLVLVVISAKAVKFLSSRNWKGRGGGLIAVLDSLSLGPNRGVYLIKAFGRVLLLGVTPERIDLLIELPPDSVPEEPEKSKQFGSLLNRMLGGDAESSARLGDLLDRTTQHLRKRAQDAQKGVQSWQ